jgi:hypothetical protein
VRDLGRVLWLGGISSTGKTSAATFLAKRYNLRLYSIGKQPWAAGARAEDARLLRELGAAGAEELADLYAAAARERFARALDELADLPDGPAIAEGRAFLPDLVAPLLRSAEQALYLLLPPDAQRQHLTRRRTAATPVPDPAVVEACVARDAELAELIREQAAAHAVRVVELEHPADAPPTVERHFLGALWSDRFGGRQR